jgi:O-antigen/teichoic acid export membrane protein
VNLITIIRKRRALSGVQTTAFVSGGTLALGSATGILLARGLGPTARGELVAASVGPQVVAALMTLGIDEALVYLLARAKGEREVGQIYGSALVVAGAVGLLATGVSELLQWLYFAPAAQGVAAVTLYAFATFPFVNVTSQLMLGAMRARNQFALWNGCRLSVPAMYLAFMAGLAVSHRLSVSSAVLALYTSNLLLFVYLAIRLRIEAKLRFAPKSGLTLLRLGIQNHLIDIGQLINQRVDQVILTRLVSPAQLGYYAVSATYAGLALVIALAPAQHLYSQASREGRIAPDQFRSLQRRTTLVMLLAAVLTALVAPVFLAVVFGEAFAPATVPAMILAFGAPPLALSALRAAVWKGSGKPLPAAFAEGAGIVVTALGLGLFAPRFGITAAAVTSVIAYVTVTAVLFGIRAAPVVRQGTTVSEAVPQAEASLSEGGDVPT